MNLGSGLKDRKLAIFFSFDLLTTKTGCLCSGPCSDTALAFLTMTAKHCRGETAASFSGHDQAARSNLAGNLA